MTTTPASMGGPLSEAERIAWIRHRLDAVTARDVGPAKADIDAECGRLQTARLDVSVWAVVDLEFLLSRVGVLEGQLATVEKELAAAHFALDVEGWRVEADEDGVVDLYHEFSDFPMLSEVRELGAILAFIAESNEGADTARSLGLDGGGSDA